MSIAVKINLNEGLYVRDPQDTVLGRKIIDHSILLIYEHGLEGFTFKKLANKINSTEASIYRYFKCKELLLLFLISWYWEWVNYLIKINTLNVDDAQKKMQIIIKTLLLATEENSSISYINERVLQKIVTTEGIKTYRTRSVKDKNSKGFFTSYKNLIATISEVVLEVNPNFKYPQTMATNLFEMSNAHVYFSRNLPKLTNISNEKNIISDTEKMLNYFVDRLLRE